MLPRTIIIIEVKNAILVMYILYMLLCKKHPLEDLTLLEYGIRVAKFDPNVISQRTTKIKSLVVIIILVVLILLPYNMYLVLVLIHMILLVFLLRER